jgi:hypothetical protein
LVEFSAQAVTAVAADAAGNLSPASAALTYTFDNVPPVAAPTLTAAAATGVISATVGADATTAKLFAGTTDITSNFTTAKVGSVVTFTPKAGQIEYVAQALTAKAADAAGNLSPTSTALTYSFDNVPPAAPTVAAGTAGAIVVSLLATSVATTTKLFAGTTDITSKFSSTVSGSTVTYTPKAGSVEYNAQAITASAADAAGNRSASSTALAYTFDNTPPAIAITGNRSILTAGQTATINFVLSEPGSDFENIDITVSGGTLTKLAGSGTT